MTMWGVLEALQDQVGGANPDFDNRLSLDRYSGGGVIILYFSVCTMYCLDTVEGVE